MFRYLFFSSRYVGDKTSLHWYWWILSRVEISKNMSLWVSVDIPTRDSIHQYQFNNPFCRTCVLTQVPYWRAMTRPFVCSYVRPFVNNWLVSATPPTDFGQSFRNFTDKVGWQIPPPVFTSGICRYLPVWKILLKWQILANTGKLKFFWP